MNNKNELTLCHSLSHNFFILIDKLFLLKPRARVQNFDPNRPDFRFPKFRFDVVFQARKKFILFYVRFLRYETRGFCPKKFWSTSIHLSGKLALFKDQNDK
jgi:hypothetical protein